MGRRSAVFAPASTTSRLAEADLRRLEYVADRPTRSHWCVVSMAEPEEHLRVARGACCVTKRGSDLRQFQWLCREVGENPAHGRPQQYMLQRHAGVQPGTRTVAIGGEQREHRSTNAGFVRPSPSTTQ